MAYPMPPKEIVDALRRGQVIPAHPLALNAERKLDERRQRALTRYYCHAGAGGVAVGVHTTQFAIRDPEHGLFKPVLELAAETVRVCEMHLDRPLIRIGGICGRTSQAVGEATLLRDLGYHAGLLSLAAMKGESLDALVNHCRTVAEIVPLVGFYLQPAVGGCLLSVEFWRRFAEIENVIAIKMAPFNRYQTLDVIRGVAEAGAAERIALYTGNDDSIVADLLTTYRIPVNGSRLLLRIVGGLLGHWACWTKPAVDLLEQCHEAAVSKEGIPHTLLTTGTEVTDANAAFFDVANGFAGCIAGIHEILHRQGLMSGRWCLDPREELSPGQMDEINRVCEAYPHLADDEFVTEHLDEWMA